ncbi:anaerobic benzoate catabolism transcriptional regulator [Clostridium tepidiprofundi DSM 19306]|uniref:Anaerobic benzoate catabolism transcriptional regulator n=1 Tax=Clostridium tepidiprofundi DSM 19306 TaxID=1121338 RepID=A0A151B4B9_9CLOT|nr:helix-turn-helix transcriptional regulator [Clostridium tepidiprofundi]KYH34736.1 anaerobic benzoate catabolism transcriptional regulator [Clostridium tepidiprofundi DSM 19306]
MEILSLGEKIKRKRKSLNMTLKDLAGDRITPGQISLVETGKSNPSMDLLEYLAEALNTSVEYLMESEESQAENICIYYENIAETYLLDASLSLAEEYVEKSLYYAEKYHLEYRKAKNLFLRGKICIKKDELGIAQQYLLSANAIFIKNNKYEETINTFLNLGIITLKLKAYHSSSSYFKQAEKIFIDNDIGNDFLLGEIYYYIAYTFFKLEDMDNSITYSFLAQEKFKKINNKREYAKSLILLSKEYVEKGDIKNAITFSQKALRTYKELNNSYYISEIENDLGKLFYEFDNIEQSMLHLQNAKSIRIKNNDNKLVDTLVNICNNYIKLKDIDESKKVLKEIMNQVENGNNKALIRYYLLKYRIDLLESKHLEAENTLAMALEFAKSMEYLEEASEIAITLGKYYIDHGNDKKAAKYLNEGVEMFRKQGIIKDS